MKNLRWQEKLCERAHFNTKRQAHCGNMGSGTKSQSREWQRRFFPISQKEKAGLLLKSIGVILLLDYCLYRSAIALLWLIPLGYWYFRKEKEELYHRKREEARWQFKEMLLITTTGQKAGYSVENAFVKSYEDLENLYGEDSSICRMLREVKAGIANHRELSLLWKRIGNACGIVEISEFAEVFQIARESGGNMTVVMERTAEVISSKTETGKEIETFLAARKLEQKIMNGIPFALMLYLNVTSPGYFDAFYHSAQGAVLMTGSLMLYLVSYGLGDRLSKITI